MASAFRCGLGLALQGPEQDIIDHLRLDQALLQVLPACPAIEHRPDRADVGVVEVLTGDLGQPGRDGGECLAGQRDQILLRRAGEDLVVQAEKPAELG